ncbi:hypothetical protein KCV04_g16058, partial [Aureobasidium melanogenum]
MAEAQDAQHNEDDGPPYPTFMERWIENNRAPRFTGGFERLIWPFQGEFPSAISVMTEPHQNTGTPQPLFDPETGEWHEIASQSITDTKVSYLEASLMNLDCWGRDWERKHMEHADPAYDECEFVTYGDLDNDVRPFAEEPEREDGTWSWDELSPMSASHAVSLLSCDQVNKCSTSGFGIVLRSSIIGYTKICLARGGDNFSSRALRARLAAIPPPALSPNTPSLELSTPNLSAAFSCTHFSAAKQSS